MEITTRNTELIAEMKVILNDARLMSHPKIIAGLPILEFGTPPTRVVISYNGFYVVKENNGEGGINNGQLPIIACILSEHGITKKNFRQTILSRLNG